MVRCDGKRAGFSLVCNGSLYRCVCGNVGCVQTHEGACSKQGYTVLGKCLACGAVGQRELVAPEAVGLRQTLMHDGVDA